MGIINSLAAIVSPPSLTPKKPDPPKPIEYSHLPVVLCFAGGFLSSEDLVQTPPLTPYTP